MRVIIYEDRGGCWRWRAVDGNNRIIADSAEGYITKAGALKGLDNVMNEFRGDVQVLTAAATRNPVSKGANAQREQIEDVYYDQLAVYQAEGTH